MTLRPVASNGRPADDALGLEIHFADGRCHTLLIADKAGVQRTCQGLATQAQLHFSDGRGVSFEYP